MGARPAPRARPTAHRQDVVHERGRSSPLRGAGALVGFVLLVDVDVDVDGDVDVDVDATVVVVVEVDGRGDQ